MSGSGHEPPLVDVHGLSRTLVANFPDTRAAYALLVWGARAAADVLAAARDRNDSAAL